MLQRYKLWCKIPKIHPGKQKIDRKKYEIICVIEEFRLFLQLF